MSARRRGEAPATAMILAAGRGERMRPLTDDSPKPLLRAGGRPLIAWHLERLAEAGFSQVVINLGWKGEQIREYLGDGRDFGVRIRYSPEGWPALDTGGGIHNALPLLGEAPFVVLNADVWTDFPLAELRLEADAMARLVVVDNPEHNPKGDFLLRGDRLVPADGEAVTFTGIGLYRPRLFASLEPGRFPLAPVLRRAIAEDRVCGIRHHGVWIDVGTPERLEQLDQRLGQESSQ